MTSFFVGDLYPCIVLANTILTNEITFYNIIISSTRSWQKLKAERGNENVYGFWIK